MSDLCRAVAVRAGIKGKVLDSVAHGIPCVLSPVAAEATGLIDGHSTLIANSREDWVSNILQLHDDEVLWQRLSSASHALCDVSYSRSLGLQRMRTVFTYLGLDPAAMIREAA